MGCHNKKILFIFALFSFCSPVLGQTEKDSIAQAPDTITWNKTLDEVTVVAKHVRMKRNGEIEVNLSNNPIAKTKTMLEMLNFVKGVKADDSGVSIYGREGTIIYIENRRASVKELQAIPASMIKKVIVSPHAATRHGSQASGGVIRVMLKDQVGLLGSVTERLQMDKNGFVDNGLSPTIFFKQGRHALFSSLTAGYGRYLVEREQKSVSSDDVSLTSTRTKNKDFLIKENLSYTYNFSEKNFLNIFTGIDFNHFRSRLNSHTESSLLDIASKSKPVGYNAGLQYRQYLGKKTDSYVNMKYTYSGNKSKNTKSYLSDDERSDQTSEKHFNYHQLHPMVSLSFKHNQELEAGVRLNFLNDNNDNQGVRIFSLDQLTDLKYRLKGIDFNPWIEYSKTLGENLYLRLGLIYYRGRLKYEDRLKGNVYRTRQNGLFPNVLLQWMINQQTGRGLTVAYRHDYSMPNYGYYNPEPIYVSKNFYSIGNFSLKKATFDTAEMNFHLNSNWTFTLRAEWWRNIIRIMTHQSETDKNVYYTIPENVGKRKKIAASAHWNEKIGIWNTNTSLSLTTEEEKMSGRKALNRCHIVFDTSNQFQINKHIGLTAFFYAETKKKQLGFTKHGTYSFDLGGYCNLLKGDLNINLLLLNVLHKEEKVTMVGSNYDIFRTDMSPKTRAKLTAIWRFRAGKKVKMKNMNVGESPERTAPVL